MAADTLRALVSVRNPQIWSDQRRRYATVAEAIELHCTACGPLTDWESLSIRAQLQHRAKAHAIEVHGGDVDAEGWAR